MDSLKKFLCVILLIIFLILPVIVIQFLLGITTTGLNTGYYFNILKENDMYVKLSALITETLEKESRGKLPDNIKTAIKETLSEKQIKSLCKKPLARAFGSLAGILWGWNQEIEVVIETGSIKKQLIDDFGSSMPAAIAREMKNTLNKLPDNIKLSSILGKNFKEIRKQYAAYRLYWLLFLLIPLAVFLLFILLRGFTRALHWIGLGVLIPGIFIFLTSFFILVLSGLFKDYGLKDLFINELDIKEPALYNTLLDTVYGVIRGIRNTGLVFSVAGIILIIAGKIIKKRSSKKPAELPSPPAGNEETGFKNSIPVNTPDNGTGEYKEKERQTAINGKSSTGLKMNKKIIIPVMAAVAVLLLIILFITVIFPEGGLQVNGIVKKDGAVQENIDVRIYRIINLETGMIMEIASTKTDAKGRYKVNGIKLVDMYLIEAGPRESEWRKKSGYYGSRIIDLNIPGEGKDLEITMTREG